MKTGIQVRVLVNPKSGLRWSFDTLRRAIDRYWDISGNEVLYQFCQSPADGTAKAQRAVKDGADVLLVAGGDGTINTVGRALMGSNVAIGVIPAGSGNGFARHFEIPLGPDRAVRALAEAEVKRIDAGVADEVPFLITCSMAWDASIVKSFEKSLFRGVLPYVFAGVNEFFQYRLQRMDIVLDSGEKLSFSDPILFTIANLSQYGGGAKIAPHAKADDGYLELVVALNKDMPKLVQNIGRLFDGSIHKVPELITKRFKTLAVVRAESTPIQVDGELIDAGREVSIKVVPSVLNVLVPKGIADKS